MRTILTFCFLAILGISGNAFAQKSDVKIKKNTVYINGSECLTVDQSLAGISFYDANGEEIVYMQYYDKTDVQRLTRKSYSYNKER